MVARSSETDDRRRAPRLPAARGSCGHIRSTVQVEIVDVSALGMKLELATSLRPGSVYDMKADLGGFLLVAQVRITRCAGGGYRYEGRGGRLLLFRAGGEILWSDDKARRGFEAYLERSRDARPPSSPGILRPRS